MTASPRPTNRLAAERSPYLLQHARNPVDWMPWGDAAFERARREDKPVFLSIGYSACHWCHVMERESFEDEATAALLNEHFVSVKVDCEERPDVDQTYQLAHQVLTQRGGGWPLSMFLTPDRKPFFGGTYFPDRRRYGMPSFTDVLRALHDAWATRRDEVTAQSDEFTALLARATASAPDAGVTPRDVLREAVKRVLPRVDRDLGGLAGAPKFPNTMTFDLLAAVAASGDEGAREALAITLDAMARGGIWDHLGGGFARYSTDIRWHVPHFEKMLYDNAQLARLYLDGARLVGDRDAITPARCREVVRETFAYVLREMTSPEGTFYSAQDADSEGEEGRFFSWTPDEVRAVVGDDDAAVVCAWFEVTALGNWEGGRSVLHTPASRDEIARRLKRPVEALDAALARARPKLMEARALRPKPMRDDKCLAGWNALMIGALADAGASLDEPAWIDAAKRGLDAWRAAAWSSPRLAHAMKDGTAYGEGFLDDYGGMAGAAIDVYEATGDAASLAFAKGLLDAVVTRFVDPATGELCFTSSEAEVVLYRSRDPYDHAYPGGAGLAVDALARLAELTGNKTFHEVAERAAGVYAARAATQPMGMASLTRAVDRVARSSIEVIVMGDRARSDTRAMLAAARRVMVPRRLLICVASADEAIGHGLDAALFEGRAAGPDGAPVAFVCRGTACEMPARTPEALTATLKRAASAA